MPRRGRPRGIASHERQLLMERALIEDAAWVVPPIVNRDTRLIATMNPASGSLRLQGWERDGPVTAELNLSAPANDPYSV
jgi:hypothetical protein